MENALYKYLFIIIIIKLIFLPARGKILFMTDYS